MTIQTILITPARPGRFDARLAGSDQYLVEGSRTPFCDAARALLAAGLADPGDTLAMRHAGSEHDALRARVGVAAKLTVDETAGNGTPRFVRHRPDRFATLQQEGSQGVGISSPMRSGDLPATPIAPTGAGQRIEPPAGSPAASVREDTASFEAGGLRPAQDAPNPRPGASIRGLKGEGGTQTARTGRDDAKSPYTTGDFWATEDERPAPDGPSGLPAGFIAPPLTGLTGATGAAAG
jgi:hypothetical protein